MGTISMTLYPASVVKRETERLLKRARRAAEALGC